MAKLITLSGSLCTLCHLIPELYPVVSLSIFSSAALGMAVCVARSLVVYLVFSSGTDCHGRLSQTHAPSAPFHSDTSPQPASNLPACLQQISVHKGLSTVHYFRHKVRGNQWTEVFFFSEKGS